MKTKHKIIIRVAVFLAVFIFIFSALGNFFQPVWLTWNNYYTTHGFYEEPDNTIETLFLGSSVMVNGVAPTELYSEYGISAYNLATEQQPMLASYYWLEEAYKHHSKTLKNVVIDVSLIRSATEISLYHKAIDPMKFSTTKIKAILDHTNGIQDAIFYFNSFITYHDRWKSLTVSDFDNDVIDPVNGTRGYNFELNTYIEDYSDYIKINNTLLDENAKPSSLYDEGVKYFKKLIEFCKEKGITVVPIKTPAVNWRSAEHNAAAELLAEYDLELLDFNFEPLLSDLGHIHPYDSAEGGHLNYYGALKLTKWLGKYLVENCTVTDVRNNADYQHLNDQLDEYKDRVIQKAELEAAYDLAEYLEITLKRNNTVFIAVKGDGAGALTDAQRSKVKNLGLKKLSELELNDSYIAVIENGSVITEQVKSADVSDNTGISFSGTIDGASYSVTSAGASHGNKASILINDVEESNNSTAINVVVYNNNIKEIVNATAFNSKTAELKKEEYSLKTMYTYDAATKLGKSIDSYKQLINISRSALSFRQTAGFDNFSEYLKQYEDKKYVIIMSVMDEASHGITDASRKLLKELGLNELSKISYRDSYLAVIEDGALVNESRSNDSKPLSYKEGIFEAKSAGYNAGSISIIKINGQDYSLHQRGINVVVYDKELEKVVSTTAFDSCSYALK